MSLLLLLKLLTVSIMTLTALGMIILSVKWVCMWVGPKKNTNQ